MLFNSYVFALFFACVLPVYYTLGLRWQNRFLVLASYVFYGWWDWRFCGLIALSTFVDYFVGLALEARTDERARRWLVTTSVLVNLGILGVFKYFNFFSDSALALLCRLGFSPDPIGLSVVLPVGISFYTFQTMSYTIDIYRRQGRATRDFEAFALYVCYFPQLVAGPIERSTRLLPQIENPRRVRTGQLHSGTILILIGIFKKVAVADAVAPLVDAAFENPTAFSSGTLLLGIYLYALQIYCDFSGYSNIARGVSRLMGIELMVNFRQPYLAANITDFWRRWHISLSGWLRDYLYIPLGGNRSGRYVTYRNIFLTMLLGGLWHGAGWNFVLWGGLHGGFLILHKVYSRRPRQRVRRTNSTVRRAFATLGTFHLVCLTWIFFRASDIEAAFTYLSGIVTRVGSPSLGYVAFAAVYWAAVLALDAESFRRNAEHPFTHVASPWARGIAYAGMLSLTLWVGTPNAIPFIYFRF